MRYLKLTAAAAAAALISAACTTKTVTTDPATAQAAPCQPGGELHLQVDSPDWRDQVIYMLFLDRFDDGNPGNNDQGRDVYDPEKPTHFSGGDLQGVIDRIDYLKSLGVTAVWISPPVENQWWSSLYQAAGWHGYWATNFKKVDPHFGTLDDYKRLSHELHCNGMYLIQDIVANHTANWFSYEGNYNPDNTAENFRLLEAESYQPAPTQKPFDLIDRANPEHVAADIYHWTPSIEDYADTQIRYTHQLGALADINTENPVVIDALKDTYKYWIDEVGVDGYRIDTVIYVPHEFWHRWAHDPDGIYAHARKRGKDHFISFGETFLLSEPFDDAGEQEIATFFGTEDKPGLNSMLGFPLFFEINRVFGQGQPTRQLEYRLNQAMTAYPDPFVTPNFVDNHDTPRFLATGHVAALKQALAMVFTIPGIPILYQGTEQAHPETRMAMFQGGHRNPEGSFDPDSEMYGYVQRLAQLRRDHPVLTRGDLKVVASEAAGPGVFVYRRDGDGESALIVLNSADHSVLANNINVAAAPGTVFETLFSIGYDGSVAANAAGRLDLTLPPRAVLVLRPTDETQAASVSESLALTVDPLAQETFSADFTLSGSSGGGGSTLELLINGNADRRQTFSTAADGTWRTTVPVRDLGDATNYVQVYAPDSGELSDRVVYQTRVTEAELTRTLADAGDDGYGPGGDYVRPQQEQSDRQREIESIELRAAGRNLEVILTMAQVSDVWLPPHGFDNVAVTTFFDFPDRSGKQALPLLDAAWPGVGDWDLAHFASGWISYTYSARGADAEHQGEKLGVSPQVQGNTEDRTIRFLFEGSKLGVDDWSGVRVYATTWDVSGEGVYVDFTPEPTDWFFSGGAAGDPKIMDDVLLTLEPNPQNP